MAELERACVLSGATWIIRKGRTSPPPCDGVSPNPPPSRPPDRRPENASRRRLVLSSAGAAALFAVSVLGFWAPARDAVADLFGLRGVLFSREPVPVPPGERLHLGDAVPRPEQSDRGRVG